VQVEATVEAGLHLGLYMIYISVLCDSREVKYTWAAPVAGKSNRVFCTSCHSDFNCDRGIYELKRHENNAKHVNNEAK